MIEGHRVVRDSMVRFRHAIFPRGSRRESAGRWMKQQVGELLQHWRVRSAAPAFQAAEHTGVPSTAPAPAPEFGTQAEPGSEACIAVGSALADPDSALPAPELSDDARSLMRRFASLETPDNRHFFRALSIHLAASRDDPCLPMYFNFALSANERGAKAADLIASIVPLEGKRALDVGCAYGGFLVGLAGRGAEPTGFDVDRSLLALGEHNFRDVGRRFPVHLADVTRPEDVARFREGFDVITCNDVIEHVSDPAAAIRHVGSMLRPGGLAYFEIPNRDEVSAVIADGHYQLFGITQLDREDAYRYFDAHAPGVPYGVEYYLQLHEYRALFEQAGLTMEIRLDAASMRPIDSIRDPLAELRRTLADRLGRVPSAVRADVERAVGQYLDEAESAPVDSPGDRLDFLTRYGVAFWRVIVRKPSARATSLGPDPD